MVITNVARGAPECLCWAGKVDFTAFSQFCYYQFGFQSLESSKSLRKALTWDWQAVCAGGHHLYNHRPGHPGTRGSKSRRQEGFIRESEGPQSRGRGMGCAMIKKKSEWAERAARKSAVRGTDLCESTGVLCNGLINQPQCQSLRPVQQCCKKKQGGLV